MLPRTPVLAGCLGVWCRVLRARIVCMLPRAMVPRARPNGLDVSRGTARGGTLRRLSLCSRASPMVPLSLRAAALRSFVAAQFYVLPRPMVAAQFYVLPGPMVPRSSLCCRVPCCRAVLRVAASSVVAQFYVLPRPTLPRNSLYFRVPCCRAVLRVAASPVAAQFSVLPRPMVPRSSLCCRVPHSKNHYVRGNVLRNVVLRRIC